MTKLINQIVLDNRRGIAQKVMYGVFERIHEKTGKEPVEVFEAATNNIMSVLEVEMKRIDGVTYQMPIGVKSEGRRAPALRQLTNLSRAHGGKVQEGRLVAEPVDVVNSTGSAVKGKGDMHRMAKTNKTSAHYRF